MVEFFIGVVLGIIFFGGLYVTVQKLPEVKYPALLMGLSMILRMGVLLGALFYVSKSGYKAVLLALLGMMLVKFAMIFVVKKPKKNPPKGGE